MEVTSRQEARKLIDKLRIHNGGLTPQTIEFLQSTEPEVLETIYALRRQLGASTKIVAEQLYHKKTRFVYELIQNAEDNQYSSWGQPRLGFILNQDCIIIDSNEDGFTERNIRAICAVGQSTKTYIQGYIGEKGIGFKSVFTVASKVHVQSEPYSFAFEYRRDDTNDNGLGMVTPLYEEHRPIPAGVRTRMILYLREDCDRAQLRQDFLALPDTLLLFLKKLTQLSVKIELPDSPPHHVRYTILADKTSKARGRATITKEVGNETSRQEFWIKRRLVSDMPADPARRNIYEAEVVLAFPIDAKESPVIEDQHVFAFLPLQKVGFKFLIQSDFITQANREDVCDCDWNRRLIKEVTQTFLHTIADSDGFLHHPVMKYSWVRYIPTANIIHDMWGRLQASLTEALHTRKVFYSLEDQYRCWSAAQLRVVTDHFRDEKSEPLLPDLKSGGTAYISNGYDQQLDLPVMKKLGTTDLSLSDFLERLSEDLEKDDKARLRSTFVIDAWQTKVSELLIKGLEFTKERYMIQRLKIVPLDNGKWVCPLNASIFFPSSAEINIPKDLSLNLVDAGTLLNDRRRVLFSALGVTECAPVRVFPLIEQRYKDQRPLKYSNLYQDVEFLFWHNIALPANYPIYLATLHCDKYRIGETFTGDWLYCPQSEDPHSMYNLLGGVVPEELKSKIKIPRIGYYDALKDRGVRNNLTGPEWLRSRANINVTPQLHSKPGFSCKLQLSAEMIYVMEHIPQHLLRVLERKRAQYQKSEEWDVRFKAVKVPVLDCAESRALEKTFLPLPKLKAKAAELCLSKSFGFLSELDGMEDIDVMKWRFLERLGVGVEEDVSFWLALLRQARHTEDVKTEYVFKIYLRLQTFSEGRDIQKLREAFKDDLIYVPSIDSATDWSWTDLSKCVWRGPKWFLYYDCLQSVSEYQSLYGLLVNSLALKEYVTQTGFLDYLEDIKTRASRDCATREEKTVTIPLIYGELSKVALGGKLQMAKEEINSRIRKGELVYCPKSLSWRSQSGCIWAEDQIQLPEKLSLATSYKKQETFFRNVLDVKEPSVEMHIRALIQKASDSPNKDSILQEMKNICALDASSITLYTKLSDCAFLPVKQPSGETEWMSCTGAFAIADRHEYERMFRDRITILKFTLEEVHSVEKLLCGLRLGPRFLSKAVTEETRVTAGVMHQKLTNDLRKKAYAICRYAAHLAAPDAAAIYPLLQNAKVYTGENISKVVSIVQGTETIAIPGDAAYCHIDQDNDQLDLYVPKAVKQRQVALARVLPLKLLQHLGVHPTEKAAGLGAIISSSSLFVVDEILQQDGIIEVAGVSRPEEEEEDEDEDAEQRGGVVTVAVPQSGTQGSCGVSQSGFQGSYGITYADLATNQAGTNPGRMSYDEGTSDYFSGGNHRSESGSANYDPFWTPATTASYGSQGSPERPELYAKIVEHVIQQANGIKGLPTIGTFELASVEAEAGLNAHLAIRSSIPGEELFKIGAAGELFVFELLNRLGLPGFDVTCWQSTIRHRVCVHDQYRSMTRWNGVETADIVYRDADSALTQLLVQQGYLEGSAWSGRSPTYCIEVKTTTGDSGNPFFFSQRQYDRMERMQLPDSGHSEDIYLVARVFGLGHSRMGLRLFIDPATLRRKKELTFVADRYTVTSSVYV